MLTQTNDPLILKKQEQKYKQRGKEVHKGWSQVVTLKLHKKITIST